GWRAGDRLELERHIVAARQFAGEIISRPADFAGRRIAYRLRRVGTEIGRAQRAAGRNVTSHHRWSACKYRGHRHEAQSAQLIAPSTFASALASPGQDVTEIAGSRRARQLQAGEPRAERL